jgi:6-pyruvoyl-tetrahydropterin synthase
MDGMLIDYGELDKIVKPIIEEMDHRYIVSQSNHVAHDVYEKPALLAGHAYPLNMPASTGEYLAQFLWNEILFALQGRCKNDELIVKVNETPKSTASYNE